MTRFSCPHSQHPMKASSNYAGTVQCCTRCRQPLRVPIPEAIPRQAPTSSRDGSWKDPRDKDQLPPKERGEPLPDRSRGFVKFVVWVSAITGTVAMGFALIHQRDPARSREESPRVTPINPSTSESDQRIAGDETSPLSTSGEVITNNIYVQFAPHLLSNLFDGNNPEKESIPGPQLGVTFRLSGQTSRYRAPTRKEANEVAKYLARKRPELMAKAWSYAAIVGEDPNHPDYKRFGCLARYRGRLNYYVVAWDAEHGLTLIADSEDGQGGFLCLPEGG